MAAPDVRLLSRYGQGVVLMRLSEESKVISFSSTPREDGSKEEELKVVESDEDELVEAVTIETEAIEDESIEDVSLDNFMIED